MCNGGADLEKEVYGEMDDVRSAELLLDTYS
jgi:hypothetical protein